MASRSEHQYHDTRRNNRHGRRGVRNGGKFDGSTAQATALEEVEVARTEEMPAECSPTLQLHAASSETSGDVVKTTEAPTQSISILKEIFPDHGLNTSEPAAQCNAPPAAARAPPAIHQLLGGIPSPARAGASGALPPPPRASAPQLAPSQAGPTVHGASSAPPMAPPVLPPESFEMQRAGFTPSPMQVEPPCSNYRERLRAGGRGAFQRAFDMGLVPKNMRQCDWSNTSAPTQGMMGQQIDTSHMGDSPYALCGPDASQQMWNGGMHSQMAQGLGGGDYWSMMPQQQQQQVSYMQQMPQVMSQTPQLPQMAQPPQQPPQMFPQMPFQPQHSQQLQQPMSMGAPYPTSQGASAPPSMAPPVVSLPQAALGLPQPAMDSGSMACIGAAPMTPVAASDSTPSDVDRCTSFLKYSFGDFDSDFMAAQLKAAANDQVYED